MVGFWRGLSASLERHGTWTDAQRSLALDLLGIHPDLRDAETPVDPAEGDAFEARRGVVAAEVARLESLRDGELAIRDAEERAMAESTLGAELTKPLQLMHRYESAALRRQNSAWRKLDEATKGSVTDAASARATMLSHASLIRRPVVEWPNGDLSVGFTLDSFKQHTRET